jgi:hypothetical protein
LILATAATVVVVLALPTVLGTKWIYEPVLRQLAKEQIDLRIESVKLRWFSPIEFSGISLRQAETSGTETSGSDHSNDPPIMTIRSIKSDRGLAGFLWNGRDLGKLVIDEPKLDITLFEDGNSLERIIQSIRKSQGSKPASNSNSISTKSAKSKLQLDLDVMIHRLSVEIAPTPFNAAIPVIPPLDVELSYLALEGEPQLVVKPAQLLNQADITPELVEMGLGIAIPFLAKSAWFDGRVSLSTQEIRIPLDRPLQSSGEAILTLHQVRSGPSEPLIVGVLDTIAKLRGKEPTHELVFVDGSNITVRVENEQVHHSGLEAGLPKLDERLQISSEGSVGLVDKSLDLRVQIPVPVEQLARRDSVKQLGVPRMTLPIGGTIEHPEVEWSAMRGDSAAIFTLISGQLRNEAPITGSIVEAIGSVAGGEADQAIGAAVDFVKQLRERRLHHRDPKDTDPSSDILPDGSTDDAAKKDPAQDRDAKPRRPLRDALRKRLRGE